MGISVVGGATALASTPVLQIQRLAFNSTAAGYSQYGTEVSQDYTLTTPLVAGNYFVTFTTTVTSTQVVGILDNGTTAFNIQQSSAGTNSSSFVVNSGRTLTKIVFLRNLASGSWPTSLSLNIVASTDTPTWGGDVKTSNNTTYNLPALPAGYTDISNGQTLSSSRISLDGTKTYVMAMVSSAKSKNIAYPTTSFSDSNTLNSQMKFYEYNFTTGALTEKAQPVFNATTTCSLSSWAPGLSAAGHSASINHFVEAATFVSPNYVYFDPGYMSGSYYNGSSYNSWFEYGQMGRYDIAANTWTAVQGPRASGRPLLAAQTYIGRSTTSGDKFVVAGSTLYKRNAYISTDTIQSWQNAWVSLGYDNAVGYYNPSSNSWVTGTATNLTGSYIYLKNSAYNGGAPGTDKYLFTDAYSAGQSSPGTQTYSQEVLDISTGSSIVKKTIPVSGMYIYGSSGASVGAFNFMGTSWVKHPTDNTKIYIQLKDNPIWYLFNVDAYGAQTSTGSASYLTKTKWRDTNFYQYQGYYGFLYFPATDKLCIDMNGAFSFTTSVQNNKTLFYEFTPLPTGTETL